MIAYAHGQICRTDTTLCIFAHDVFDEAIFQRMVADNAQHPARIKPANCLSKTLIQGIEFVIDFDAKRLKGLPRRVLRLV